MNKIFAIILSLSILVLSSGKTFILLNYAVNKEFITKNLCENRNKPQMNCNGKCRLKKELQKEEKKDQSPFSSMKEKVELQLFHSVCAVNSTPFGTSAEQATATQMTTNISGMFHYE